MSDAVKCPKCQFVYQVSSRENWGVCTNCGVNNDKLNPGPGEVPELVSHDMIPLLNRKTRYGEVKDLMDAILKDSLRILDPNVRFALQRRARALEGILRGKDKNNIRLYKEEADWYASRVN